MDEYTKVKTSKLILKGEKSHKKHKSKKRKHDRERPEEKSEKDIDTMKNGGWWAITHSSEIKGTVAIEIGGKRSYIRALDNGNFAVGAPHDEGEGPAPEEILSVVPGGLESKIALKSGYDKYLGVTSGKVTGFADAVGQRELWEPVFQDDKTAFLASNECFLGVDEDDSIIAEASSVSEDNIIIIRTNRIRNNNLKSDVPIEEQGTLYDVEKNYVKKFQKFQNKKIKISQESVTELKKAKTEGYLHESLLDRRSKQKADRYCK